MYLIATISADISKKNKIGLIKSGVNVFRYNFAYGEPADTLKRIERDRIMIKNSKGHPKVKIFADLPGAKIRIKNLGDGLKVNYGEKIIFSGSELADSKYKHILVDLDIIKKIRVGTTISIGDGNLAFKILKKLNSFTIVGRVLNDGMVYPNKSLNIGPGIDLLDHTSVAMDKLKNFHIVRPDWIGLSFVRSEQDLLRIRAKIKETKRWHPRVVAKIESPLGVKNIGKIVLLSDIIMVARGDLGVNCAFEKLGILQRKIIVAAKKGNREVVVATQILNSLLNNYIPNRSEISDLTSMIIDGVDGIMLVDEIVQSQSPSRSCLIAKKIIKQALNFKQYGKK